ncbi:hypothetical protein ACEWY4_002238 [Coilia grayii]|uniref:Uncharacterized protein n=1 Tax=Coilia grayii TaxID=363190 RepID=A0ABD1KV84_9TELE
MDLALSQRRHNPVDSICRKLKTIQRRDQEADTSPFHIPRFQSSSYDSPQPGLRCNLEAILKKRAMRSDHPDTPAVFTSVGSLSTSSASSSLAAAAVSGMVTPTGSPGRPQGRRLTLGASGASPLVTPRPANATYTITSTVLERRSSFGTGQKRGGGWQRTCSTPATTPSETDGYFTFGRDTPYGQPETGEATTRAGGEGEGEKKERRRSPAHSLMSYNLNFCSSDTSTLLDADLAYPALVVKRLSLGGEGTLTSSERRKETMAEVSLICEEDLLDTIFHACDTQRRGKVYVSAHLAVCWPGKVYVSAHLAVCWPGKVYVSAHLAVCWPGKVYVSAHLAVCWPGKVYVSAHLAVCWPGKVYVSAHLAVCWPGKVYVSRIVDYLRHTTSRSSEDSGLEELCNMLDPERKDISIDLDTYHAVMKEWIEDCRNHEDDTAENITQESVKALDSLAARRSALLNMTSGSLEAIGGETSRNDLETSDLIYCVADLQCTNQKLQEEMRKLKQAMEMMDDANQRLVEENEDLKAQAKAGQQLLQKEKMLKEEVEEMKLTLSSSEEGRARASAQTKQMERENQSLISKITALQEEV